MAESTAVLLKYLKKYSFWIILSVIASVGHNYLNLQLPLMLQQLVDDIVFTGNYGLLMDLFWYLIIIFFFSGIFGMIRTLIVQYIGTNVVYEVRGDMFRALQSQSYSFFDKNRTGDLMAKTTSDVQVMREFLSQSFANFIRDVITLAVILVIVFQINWMLSLIFLSIVPILFYLMIVYHHRMHSSYLKMANKSGELNSVLQENITGVRVVKAFGREEHEMQKYRDINDNFLKMNMEVVKISVNYGPLQELIMMLGSVMLLFLGGYMVLNGTLTIGEVVTFYAFFSFLYDPIRNMVHIYLQYSQVQASLIRVNSVLEHKSEIVENKTPITLPAMLGDYEFKDIWFSYENDEHYILKGLSLKVRAGERIAILGATGSGKSTFINLIPRFYDPTKGQILLDNNDIKDLKIDDYRRHIGLVSQDIFLFSRTIEENIAYGVKGKIEKDDLEKVAKIAAIHNFIISLPDGYKTIVGERGQTLSGGQKQRVAIARALLLNPRILILDDSLSAVDIDTEAQIQAALDALFKDRTTFIITQRISTVQNCDRIMVLDNGQVIELGSHEELYAKNGIYTKIYNTMFKAQSKRQLQPMAAEAVFDGLPPTDARVVKSFYEEKYPDEEKRMKAEAKRLEKIEKIKQKELKQQTEDLEDEPDEDEKNTDIKEEFEKNDLTSSENQIKEQKRPKRKINPLKNKSEVEK